MSDQLHTDRLTGKPIRNGGLEVTRLNPARWERTP